MDVLDARDELIGEQEDGLERELAIAEIEQILQAGAEEVQNHGIVIALGTEPTNEGYADTASKGLVDAGLVFELRVLGLDALELDGYLLAGDDVGAQVDVTERTRADLAADTVLITDTKVLKMGLVKHSLTSLGKGCQLSVGDYLPWSSSWRGLGKCRSTTSGMFDDSRGRPSIQVVATRKDCSSDERWLERRGEEGLSERSGAETRAMQPVLME